jgi:ribosomal protein S8
MPTEVELKLVADNKDAVKGIKEVSAESQKLYTNQEKNQKRQIGLIADVEKELSKLQTAQKNAMTIEHIEKYNKKIAEAKQALDEYNKAGLKAEEQTDSISKTIGKMALSIGGAATVLNVLKEAFLATTVGINAFNIAGAATKQVLYNLVTGAQSLTAGLGQAIAAQQKLNELRVKDIIDTFKARQQQVLFNKAYFDASDRRLTDAERIKKLDVAMAAHNKMIEIEIANTREELKATTDLLNAQPGDEDLKQKYGQLNVKLLELESERFAGVKRIESMRTGLLQEGIVKEREWREKLHDDLNKLADEQIEIDIERDKKRTQATIDDLSTVNDFLNKLDEDYFKALEEKKEKNWAFEVELGKKLFNSNREQAKLEYEARIKAGEDALKLEEELTENRVEALKRGLNELLAFTQEIADRQLEDAQRNRELLDTQIDETQEAVNQEVELYKAGYAANVQAKQKQLAELKLQREKALREEEEAIKKQRAMENIAQGVNIFTSATNLIKTYTKFGPIGLALAAGAITAMFAIVNSARSKSEEAGFASGGWTGEGGRRDKTGERVAGLVHEREFVVRRGPAHKFRSVLEAINRDDKRAIFNSFNKISPASVNNIVIDNEGSNKRLDEVNLNLKRLNNKEEVSILGNMTIYKKGNSTRIIKKR